MNLPSLNREPASIPSRYDVVKVTLLKEAAKNKILFFVPNEILKAVPVSKMGDSCKQDRPPLWQSEVYSMLQIFQANPKFYNKIHAISFVRADSPHATLSEDLDHSVTLTLGYIRKTESKPATSQSDSPCSPAPLDWKSQDIQITEFVGPNKSTIVSLLDGAKDKRDVERFQFDSGFLEYLAMRQTVLRISPERAAEKNVNAESLLKVAMDFYSQELIKEKNLVYIDLWLQNISEKSNNGTLLKLFELRNESQKSSGFDLSNESESISANHIHTFPYLTYYTKDSQFILATLKSLNACGRMLEENIRDKSPNTQGLLVNSRTRYLFRGFHCSEN